MGKYIECEAALAEVEKWHEVYPLYRVLKAIENLPAADVRPVVRGKWKRIDYDPCGHDYVCSSCNQTNDRASHYCPDCGAKMDLYGYA